MSPEPLGGHTGPWQDWPGGEASSQEVKSVQGPRAGGLRAFGRARDLWGGWQSQQLMVIKHLLYAGHQTWINSFNPHSILTHRSIQELFIEGLPWWPTD